jgi:LysR family hydrogen peroxide-inducible transcriptional activator
LNVSQPSLSAQLAEVEADLGVRLFQRSRSGVRITPVGEEILRRARQIVHEIHDLRAVVQGGGLFQGRLRLGVLPSIGPYLLPNIVQKLHREHPSLRIIIREENTQELDEGLRSGRLDMIISTPEDHPAALSLEIVKEKLWVAMALDHPLVELGKTVRLKELSGHTFMTLGAGHRLSHIVAGLATRAGGRVSDEYEGTSLDALRLMAAAGTGLAVLPNIYAATEASRGLDVHIARIDDPSAERTISLLQLASKGTNSDGEILVDALRDGAKTLIQGL